METWSSGVPFRETLRKHATENNQALDEARLDEVCRPERYLERLATALEAPQVDLAAVEPDPPDPSDPLDPPRTTT